MLLGGLRSGEVTEVVGPSSSGKTQLCLLASTAAVASASLPLSVLYVDTSQSFSVERAAELHRSLALRTPEGSILPLLPSLERLRVERCHSLHSLLLLLDSLHSSLLSLSSPFSRSFRLLVVDSLASLIAPILGGRHHRGHALLSHVHHCLHSLASTHSLAVLVTNHTVSPRSDRRGSDPGLAPGALGESWTYVADTRLQLQVVRGEGLGIGVGEGGVREGVGRTVRKAVRATLVKSSHGEVGGACTLEINQRGFTATS